MKKRSIFALGLQAGLAGLLVLLAGCASSSVKSVSHVCIQVTQFIVGVTGYQEPIAEALQDILGRMGVQATVGAGADCQAKLALTLKFIPITEKVIDEGECYLDASMSGWAILSSKGHLPSVMALKHPKATYSGPARLVFSCPRDPAGAPFASAWAEPVVTMLRKWWGAPAMMSTLKSEGYGLHSEAVSQLAETGPEAIPLLTGLLSDSDWQSRLNAVKGLETFGKAAKEAVPALIGLVDDEMITVRWAAIKTLGAIGPDARPAIPKLIQIMENMQAPDYMYASDALVKITGQHFGEDAAAWQKWYASQPQP